MRVRRLIPLSLGAAALVAASLSAQAPVPEIAFDSQADFLKMPADIHLGEAAGVATNSRGHLFVYTRTGNPTAGLGELTVLHARRRAALRVRPERRLRAGDWLRAFTRFCSRTPCALTRRTTSGSSTRPPIRS